MKTALAAVAAVFAAGLATAQTKPQYEVYAIRYATLPGFQVADLVAGADPARKVDIPTMVWLIRGGGRNILVDCGFYRERLFREWKVADFEKVPDALKRLDLKAEDITDLVLTHMHWDHAGSLDLFPKARVWIQKAEYEYYTGEAWQSRRTHGGIEADDVLELVRLNTQGRVTLVNGDGREIVPGVTCYTGGKHTYSSQYLGVSTGAGTVVLASDNVYMYENVEKHVPIAGALDPESNLRAQDRMRTLVSDPRLIVPGHDPAVFTKFPNPAPGVAKIQ